MHKTFKGVVRIKDSWLEEVTVQTGDSRNAWLMLEAQYGKGNVQGVSEVQEEAAERGSAAANLAGERPASRGATLALVLGIAIFFLLYKLGVDWKWALGIAVPVWLALGIRAAR